MCSYYFSLVSVVKWPPFGEIHVDAHSADHMLSFLFSLFVNLVISRFGFEGWIWVLIASVPDPAYF